MRFTKHRTVLSSNPRSMASALAAIGFVVLSAVIAPAHASSAPITFPGPLPCGPINPCPPPTPPEPQSTAKYISIHYHVVDAGEVGQHEVDDCKPFSRPSNSCTYTYGNYTAGHTFPFTDAQRGTFRFEPYGDLTYIVFSINGSSISGTIPSRASDQFTLTGFDVPTVGTWDEKPPNPNAGTGERLGKLEFTVNALPNYFDGIGYDIYLSGYVSVNPANLGADNPLAGLFGSS